MVLTTEYTDYPMYGSCLPPVPCVATGSLHEVKLTAICKEFVVTLPTPQVKHTMRDLPLQVISLGWEAFFGTQRFPAFLLVLLLSVACLYTLIYSLPLQMKGWGRDKGLFNLNVSIVLPTKLQALFCF